MKTSKRNKLLGLALAGGFSLFSATNVFAVAGDTISNTATLGYSVGGTGQTPLAASTSFLEDRKINFTVVREGGSVSVAPNALGQAIPFLVGNTGNGDQGFLLVGVHKDGVADPHGGTADVFTPLTAPYKTYVDSNNNAALDPVEVADGNSFIPSLAPNVGPAPGNTVRVFVVADIPALSRASNPLVSNDVAVVSLVAHAAVNNTTGVIANAIISDDNAHNSPGGTFNGAAGPIAIPAGGAVGPNPDLPGNEETVFADVAVTDGSSGITLDALAGDDTDSNAQQSSFSSYTVLTAALTVTKTSVALWDPINLADNPKAIPTGYVRYTITIANGAGAGDADLTTISDTLVASLILDPDFIDGSNVAVPPPTTGADEAFEIRHFDNTATQDEIQTCDHNTADGCDLTGQVISINIATVMANSTLQADESLTITFNVIVQ